MYKVGKVGPIVGLRTGGGGIGPYAFTPQLIDGGNVQLPNRAATIRTAPHGVSRIPASHPTLKSRLPQRIG